MDSRPERIRAVAYAALKRLRTDRKRNHEALFPDHVSTLAVTDPELIVNRRGKSHGARHDPLQSTCRFFRAQSHDLGGQVPSLVPSLRAAGSR